MLISYNGNAITYAFGLGWGGDPGAYYANVTGSDKMYSQKCIYTVDEIVDFVLDDMRVKGIAVRIVDSPDDRLHHEYIVALKTSSKIIESKGQADYHFAVQLGNGTWADKPGIYAPRWNELDGTAETWDLADETGYYDSDTRYFAVERYQW